MNELLTETYNVTYDMALRWLWLEKQVTLRGNRRTRRWQNGHFSDAAYGYFLKEFVGKDVSVFTRSRGFMATMYFIPIYFPDFPSRNPFKEPEYFKYPYEHATLDFFFLIHQVDDAKEIMDYAEERQMTFREFKNWVVNYVLSYNEEQGEEIYSISETRENITYIKKARWISDPLEKLYEVPEKETKASGGK